ncbi:MAG: hypothetical protein Q7T41_04140 [Candidatus Saccharibacteria bacterium]|nr:hypothetical protein [Candidatus Saccharibacteria bacterium]
MSLKGTLKKSNILRAGAVASTYKSAKDRPMSFQDDMFVGKDKQEPKIPKKNNNSPKKPSKNLLIACVVLTLIFVFLALTTTITWLLILLWGILLFYFWLMYTDKTVFILNISVTVFLVIFSLSSFFIVLLTQSDNSLSDDKKTSTKALTSEQCKPYYDKYNGKVLKLSSDGLQGTVGLKIDMNNGCKLLGWYNVLLSYELPQNPYKRDIGPSYHYTVMLREKDSTERTKYDGFGDLSAAYKNVTSLPDPFSDSVTRTALYSQGEQAVETRYFYWGYNLDTNFSEERYQEILDSTKLEIVNGEPFIEETQDSTGYSYSVNDDKAAETGEIVKTYTLTIED